MYQCIKCVSVCPIRESLFVTLTRYAGVHPNEMRFKRTGCFDVGVNCGNWGHLVMEFSVEDRSQPR
jgi:hypothetical protein